MCGEKSKLPIRAQDTLGSPPRVRGKARLVQRYCGNRGITPACAGKRSCTTRLTATTWDHPRVCGEKTTRFSTMLVSSGSPPRVRGKELQLFHTLAHTGITPACAGKSRERNSSHHRQGYAVRGCEEKRCYVNILSGSGGSPPRVRGKGAPSFPSPGKAGITPACAGKRSSPTRSSPASGDHPRVCGEKLEVAGVGAVKVGSPPRVRGKASDTPS